MTDFASFNQNSNRAAKQGTLTCRTLRPCAPGGSIPLLAVVLIAAAVMPVRSFGQLQATTRCVEYPVTANGGTATAIAHFDYVNFYTFNVFIPSNSIQNFTAPTSSAPPSDFYLGYHVDALRSAFPLSSGTLTWFLAQSKAAATAAGATGNATPTCTPTFVAPPALSLTQPGTYTHQYLGQVDSGPAADTRTFAVTALTAGGAPLSFTNLQYVPADSSNPSNALNPNSIYGDVTVTTGSTGTFSTLLQVSVNGTVVVEGAVEIKH